MIFSKKKTEEEKLKEFLQNQLDRILNDKDFFKQLEFLLDNIKTKNFIEDKQSIIKTDTLFFKYFISMYIKYEQEEKYLNLLEADAFTTIFNDKYIQIVEVKGFFNILYCGYYFKNCLRDFDQILRVRQSRLFIITEKATGLKLLCETKEENHHKYIQQILMKYNDEPAKYLEHQVEDILRDLEIINESKKQSTDRQLKEYLNAQELNERRQLMLLYKRHRQWFDQNKDSEVVKYENEIKVRQDGRIDELAAMFVEDDDL